jgi:hypothetical protein
MRRLAAAIFLLVSLVPAAAMAAELTRIASSFEDKHPFGMFIDGAFVRTQHRGKIVREWHQRERNSGSVDVEDVSELRYLMIDQRLNLDLHLGLWKDFEFHYGLPVVFQQNRSWTFAAGTDESNSTIINNCIQPNGDITDPGCAATSVGRRPMFEVGGASDSFRGGLGDMTFGLAYAFFNQQKDDTKPMWIIGVDYTAPTSAVIDPTLPTSAEARGAIGDKLHKYKFYNSISKRVGIADPYFQVWYTLSYWGPGWYSNCDHPNPVTMGHPENCGVGPWSRRETGIKPAHKGGLVMGSEFNAYDEPSKHQKVALDLRGVATYNSEGRYYNEMSDLLQKYLYTAEFFEVGGRVGFTAHAAEYVQLSASGELLYRSEYTLTDESIGKDFTSRSSGAPPSPCEGKANGTVDITACTEEQNPNFDWRSDMVSRRFRMSETSIFRLNIAASFSF